MTKLSMLTMQLALAACAATKDTCATGGQCPGTADVEVDGNLQLLQVGVSVHSADTVGGTAQAPAGAGAAPALAAAPAVADHALYLDTVRDILTGAILRTPSVKPGAGDASSLVHTPYNEQTRWQGADWCDYCYTMAGGARVQNVRNLVQQTISQGVPGDFLEAGTWRGGSSIMARVVQRVMGEGENRNTYLCDSFSGLPLSSQKRDGDSWNGMHFLEVSQSDVEDNVKRFNALDSNVHFRKGYFSQSLPKVREELKKKSRQLAVLRGDGDMYESYMDILYNLYDFVPVGGYFICDDCPLIAVAEQAIDDFRREHNISDPIQAVEGSSTGIFWRKGSPTEVNYDKYLEWNATRAFKSSSL